MEDIWRDKLIIRLIEYNIGVIGCLIRRERPTCKVNIDEARRLHSPIKSWLNLGGTTTQDGAFLILIQQFIGIHFELRPKNKVIT
jgi:hypothetical protein